MNKADLITWLASLPDSAPELQAVAAVCRGGQQTDKPEQWLSLAEAGRRVGKSPSWLTRLGIQAVGVSMAGKLHYRVSDVLNYLRGPECAARLDEYRKARKDRAA